MTEALASPPQTLTHKVIARAARRPSVAPGEIVTCAVDLAFAHDSSGPRRWKPQLEALGARIWDPAKVVVVSDHYVPAVDADSAEILALTRRFAAEHGVRHFDMVGISHTLLPQHGLLKPGMFVAGGDSHSSHGGAFGCFIAGYGATDMLGIIVTGETWVLVPQADRVELDGRLADGVSAKDVMLTLCAALGMENAFKTVEFAGTAVEAMSMDERMTLTNMTAELGYDAGLIEPDRVTLEHMRRHGASVETDEALSWRADPDAPYAAVRRFDLGGLVPQVAAPHSPALSAPAADFADVRIDQAYIGACVGAKIEDLRMAARVLRGRSAAPGVRLLVAPASRHVARQALEEGVMATLLDAGAILLPSGCGACAGMGAGVLSDGEVCISSTNRNFKGRMGSPEAFVYLASPATVAASAVAGRVADPREMLA